MFIWFKSHTEFLSDDDPLVNCASKIVWSNGMRFQPHILASVVRIGGKILSNCIHNFLTISIHLLLIRRIIVVVLPKNNDFNYFQSSYMFRVIEFVNRNIIIFTCKPSLSPWFFWNSWLWFFRRAFISSSFLNVQYLRWELDGNISILRIKQLFLLCVSRNCRYSSSWCWMYHWLSKILWEANEAGLTSIQQ